MSLSQLFQNLTDPNNLPYLALMTGKTPSAPLLARIGEQIIAGSIVAGVTLYGMVQVLDAKLDGVKEDVAELKQLTKQNKDEIVNLKILYYRNGQK